MYFFLRDDKILTKSIRKTSDQRGKLLNLSILLLAEENRLADWNLNHSPGFKLKLNTKIAIEIFNKSG